MPFIIIYYIIQFCCPAEVRAEVGSLQYVFLALGFACPAPCSPGPNPTPGHLMDITLRQDWSATIYTILSLIKTDNKPHLHFLSKKIVTSGLKIIYLGSIDSNALKYQLKYNGNNGKFTNSENHAQ